MRKFQSLCNKPYGMYAKTMEDLSSLALLINTMCCFTVADFSKSGTISPSFLFCVKRRARKLLKA